MIHAESPDKIGVNQTEPKGISQVYGFSSQTANQATNQIVPQPIDLPPNPPQTVSEHHYTPEWQKTFFHWWHKIALVLLVAHGLVGLWESIQFMFIEYPELNKALQLHHIEASEVNQLLSRAIITVVATFVTVLFAIRLSKVKETTAHNIDLLISTFLIITTSFIQNFLSQLDLLNYILGILAQ